MGRQNSGARAILAEQDALIIAERLLAWTDEAVCEDLEAYAEVDPGDALKARDLLLSWLKQIEREHPDDEDAIG